MSETAIVRDHLRDREPSKAIVLLQKMKSGKERDSLLLETFDKIKILKLGKSRDHLLITVAKLCDNALLSEIIPLLSSPSLKDGCEKVLSNRAQRIVDRLHGISEEDTSS